MTRRTTSIPAGLSMAVARVYAEKVLGWPKANGKVRPGMDIYLAGQDINGHPLEVWMPLHENDPITADYFHVTVSLMAVLQNVSEDDILAALRNAPFQIWEAGGITDDEALALLEPQLAHYDALAEEVTRRRDELQEQAGLIAMIKLNTRESAADDKEPSPMA